MESLNVIEQALKKEQSRLNMLQQELKEAHVQKIVLSDKIELCTQAIADLEHAKGLLEKEFDNPTNCKE